MWYVEKGDYTKDRGIRKILLSAIGTSIVETSRQTLSGLPFIDYDKL
jgi:hypothetical protein